MSRRDIIIISALINAGLLIVLFVTAIKTPEASRDLAKAAPQMAPPVQELALPQVPIQSQPADEVDRMLSQLAAQNTPTPQATPPTAPASWEKEAQELTITEPPALTPIATTATGHTSKQQSSPAPRAMPASKPAVSSSSNPDYVEVKIKQGDYLDKIARMNKTTVSEIMQVNHLSSTNLRIGQVLRVPQNTRNSSRAAPSQTSGPKYYVVRNGDNPWTIASKNKIKLSELLRLNELDEESARQLKPGDQLRIR